MPAAGWEGKTTSERGRHRSEGKEDLDSRERKHPETSRESQVTGQTRWPKGRVLQARKQSKGKEKCNTFVFGGA